ncbi:helix-turn-helix transcriptional regulator [Neobacillus cucumis]|uniref:helix-turn-helix transcriptional regulator n=1 Tax=Neobacillus cucumis TaxID=1740721 RepID=UPI001EF7CA8D|nr:helix-turn-helix transcriptional regulator [Neobacillus cucumis]MBM7656248.1 CBS domain-containing protein/biotin operon repressor [Neobacillus cucumis]MDR4948093.1 helix-turn-helix transcriptional regulator [Neobacillus cucumis]MED4225767.1 helix-turn-helix transcriptional regulator [Neobacillus cucumis]
MIKLSKRQDEILEIVKQNGPITGKEIADKLSLSRAALRPDLAILTMSGNIDARPRVGYFYNENFKVKRTAEKYLQQKVNNYKAHPIVVGKSISVYDAIVQLFLEDVGTLYAVNSEGHLAGVISRKDLLRASLGNSNLSELPVSVIMTRMPNIITISPEESLLEAAKKMIQNHIDSLPVVRDVDGQENTYLLVGRITKTTITRAYLEMMEEKSD